MQILAFEWSLFSYYGSIDTDSGDIGIDPVTRKWELKHVTMRKTVFMESDPEVELKLACSATKTNKGADQSHWSRLCRSHATKSSFIVLRDILKMGYYNDILGRYCPTL